MKDQIFDLEGTLVGLVWRESDGSWCWRTANSRGFGNRQERKAAIKALMDAHLVLSGLPHLPRRIVEDKPKRSRTVVEQADDILRAQRDQERLGGRPPITPQTGWTPVPDRHAKPATRRVFAMPPSSTEPLQDHDSKALKNLASGIGAALDRAKERA